MTDLIHGSVIDVDSCVDQLGQPASLRMGVPVRITFANGMFTARQGRYHTFAVGQWTANGSPISGQTALTYTPTPDVAGQAIGFIPTNPVPTSNTITLPVVAPSPITGLTLTAGAGMVSAAFTMPTYSGGAAVNRIDILLSNGQAGFGTLSPIVIPTPNGIPVTAIGFATSGFGTNTPLSSPASAVSNSVTPTSGTPTASLRQVATSTQAPNATNAAVAKCYSRSPHFIQSTVVSGLVVTVPAWFATGGSTETALASVTWTGSLEYPAGTFQQLTWGGQTSVTITDGTERDCDPIANIPPKGSKVWVRLFQQAAGGVCFFNFYAGDGTAQFVGGSGATDLTLGGGATVAGSGNASMVVPINIKGISADPAFGIGIDSIGVGRGDSSSGLPYQGYYERAFAPSYACGHFGSSGDLLSTFLASHARRLNMSSWYTHILLEGGINDITGGASAATVATNYDAVVALFGGKPVASAALNPVTTSTDGWVTTANQTVVASDPVRITENTRRASGTTGVKVFYNVNLQMESVPSPENGITTAGYVSDGTHPNATGAAATAAAMNIALMLA